MRTTTLLRSVLAAMMVMLCSAVGATDAPKVNTSALSTYDKNAPIGFGASITGSGDENPVTVTTLAELTNALTGTDAKTIYVSGTITFTGSVEISGVQNKTIYGLEGATFENLTHSGNKTETGILKLTSCDNIIIRNITFKGAGAYDIDGNDNLTLSGSSNIWIDHCDFQDGVDGNLDCNNGSDNICVSWCRFRYLISPWSGGSGGSKDHRFSNLWGGGDTATGDEGKLNTTFYACWWDDGCKQRMPRVRFGKVHILNCLYSSSVADYCIGAGYKSNLYVENSVFNVSTDKVWQCYATESGYTDYNIKLVGNSGAADDTKSSGSITQFEPTYNYTAIAASDVQAAVTAANGAGATLTYGEEVELTGTLIDFPTSNAGITVNGNTEFTTAEGYTVCKFSSGYTGGNAGKNAALTISGGFKTGDVITVAGFIKNSDTTKSGTVTLFSASNEAGSEGISNIKTFENFANLQKSETITEQSYTLVSDYDKLFLGRTGGTATNLTVIKVVRSGGEAPDPEPDPEPAPEPDPEPTTSYPITAKWDFQNLVPATLANVNIQGTNEDDVASNEDGIVMHVISAGGKLQYNSSGYAQFNTNTTIQVPVLNATDVVTVVSYPGQSHYTVGGDNAEGQNSFNHTATAAEVKQGYVEIIPTATAYIYSIQVVQNEPAGSGEEPGEEVAGSVTWAVGNETEATISSGISDAILTSGVTVGSGLTATSKTYLETSMIAYQPTTSNPGAVASAMIEYRVKVYPGIKFKPTSVSYNAVKDGTDNATYKWSYTIDGAESAITEVSKDDIVRNNNTTGTPAMQHTHNLTASKCDEFTFRIYVSGFGNTKKLAIGNVVISGTVSGTKAPLETYTVTFANNDADAQGTAPSAVNVTQYESTTMPVNKTLYKDGYTLTGWTDGSATYNIGTDFTPTANTTLNPVFTQNTVSLSETLKPVVIKWEFQTGQGAPTLELQNNSGILVTQATVNKSTIDVKLGIDATSGKFNNASWTDWCQVNEGTIFTLPSKNGAVVEAYSMSEPKNATDVKSDLDGNDYTSYTSGVATYSTTNESGSSVLVIKGGGYYRYIQLTYPGSGLAWANFESFEMDLRNGAYLTSSETSNTTIGFKKSGDNIVRSDANDDANIGTITGKFHSDDHGLQNFSMMVAVPGYVRVSAGTCAWGGDLSINGTNGFSYTVNTNTGACYHQNTTANKVYAYYTSNEGTTLTIAGGSYMPYIAVESVDSYTLTGTISGGNIDGKDVILTSELTGQSFTATIASGAFTVNVPADTYAITLSDNEGFVISDPTSVAVSADAPLTINVVSAIPQTVSGDITNAPAEAFTLTFTGASYTETVECAANATSFTKDLMPDTYVISSNVGTLSPLSVESFKVVNAAVTHNIYFPEVIPAATQAEITVDKAATVAANIYNNVSDALAAAKAGNISSPVITLTSGQTYREQVIVDQANVTLKTSGAEKAKITFYYGIGYAYYSLNDKGYYDKDRAMTRNSAINMRDPDRWGCSVKVTNKGTNFRAENIIFENSFNQYYTDEEVLDGVTPNGVQSISYDRTLTDGKSGYQAADAKAVTERAAAIAFENNPTGVELYNCTFIGSQDTYYTSGTMYVKDCNIVGNTDYIFGGGYVVFDNCDLTIGGYSDKETSAYITAYNGNGRYIFRDCTVKSGGRKYVSANLGRDWGGTNASVYYFNLKNEIGNKLEYKWQNMGGAVSAGTADLHIYDFDPTVNANYSTTGSTDANINGVLSEADALTLYGDVVTSLGFTPERIYADAVELSESSAYNKCRIAASDEATRNVTLTRSITGGNWSTICLPFGMTAAQVTATFGTDTKLATISGYNSDTKEVTTASATTIAANTPCFIKVADNVSEGTTIEGVTFVSGEPEIVIDGDFKYVGVYSQTDMASGDFFLANNKLYKATENTSAIKPFRAYFTGVPANARILFTDGEATRIDTTLMGGDSENGDVYDLQGRRVERPVKKGLYINGGRKVIIK